MTRLPDRRTPCFSPPASTMKTTASSARSLPSTASTATKSRFGRSSLLVIRIGRNGRGVTVSAVSSSKYKVIEQRKPRPPRRHHVFKPKRPARRLRIHHKHNRQHPRLPHRRAPPSSFLPSHLPAAQAQFLVPA